MKNDITTVEYEGIPVKIKEFLTMKETSKIINDIVGACYDEANEQFIIEHYDFIFKVHIILAYSDYKLPESLDDKYEFVYNSSLYSFVEKHINKYQVNNIYEISKFYIFGK